METAFFFIGVAVAMIGFFGVAAIVAKVLGRMGK